MIDNTGRRAVGDSPSAGADLLELAYPYALHATAAEETAIDARLMLTDNGTRLAFDEFTRDVHETMALVAAVSSCAPPPSLRARLLDAIESEPQDLHRRPAPSTTPRHARLRTAAAAAVAIATTARRRKLR